MPRQTDTIDRLAPHSRVAVIRLRSLGDCVLMTPALDLLRQYRPDLKIAAVVEDRFAALLENPLSPTIRAVRDFAPHLCLNLHGGTRSARLALLSGADIRPAFDIFHPSLIYNVAIPTAQETLGVTRRVHTAEHAASAMFHLGVPIGEIPRARILAPAGRSPFAPASPYVVIHPLAATPAKTWPAAGFLELASKLDLEPVFVAGPGEDLAPFEKWRTVSAPPIAELARLLRDASLFIGNDSGPAHVAAAFGVPEVVFFGPSDAEIWSPWRTTAAVLKAEGPIDSITVETALDAVSRVRAGNPVEGQ